MGILIFLLALISPRLVLFLMWLFDYSKFGIAYDNFLIPFLGFLFLPVTTLVYIFAYSPLQGISGYGWIVMILAVLVDLGTYAGSSKR